MPADKLKLLQKEILEYFQGKGSDFKLLNNSALDELAIYKSLTINAFEEYLENLFPCTYTILQERILEVAQDYLERYKISSAIYYQSAKEFPTFIKSDFFQKKYDAPNYLYELALVEWTEIEVRNSAQAIKVKIDLEYPISKIKFLINNHPEEINELREANVDEETESIEFIQNSDNSF